MTTVQPEGPSYGAFESVTVSTVAVALTSGTYGSNTKALITVESQAIRFRLDGTAPTASVGHVVEAGDSIVLTSAHQLANFKAIRRDGSDATIRASYGV